jgi:hypothetical protein
VRHSQKIDEVVPFAQVLPGVSTAMVGSTHDLASRNALFIMSSAPGPMMSELKDDVVLRMCDTGVSDDGQNRD